MGAWVRGCVGAWMCGCVGMLVCGYVGMYGYMHVCEFILDNLQIHIIINLVSRFHLIDFCTGKDEMLLLKTEVFEKVQTESSINIS